MSISYFIRLENKPADLDSSVNGQFVAAAAEDLQQMAAELGVRPLESFFAVTADDPAALIGDDDEEPVAETVSRLGLRRDPDFTYYVEGSQVKRQRRKRPGSRPSSVEIVADLGVAQDHRWVYFVDEAGDVARSPKESAAGESGAGWFEAQEGLEVVQALRARVDTFDERDLSQDLLRFEAVLLAAARRKVRFRLSVDF
jgi:hypothetical protein